jgi:Flp pilus assembly protein TadG
MVVHRTNPRLQGETGAAAVFLACGMVGLLAFAGLVLDGGNAFSQRRQMQNAADVAAMAGANELYRYKAGATGTDVYAAARAVALENGADPATFTCELVLYTAGSETGTAPCQGASNVNKTAAWTVRVSVDATHDTTLMRAVNIDSFTAGAEAAASLLQGGVANSPFMICAAIGTAHDPPLLAADPTDPTGWAVNPAAIGNVYDIWGNAIKDSDCGLGNDFRGLVDNASSYTIPGTWPAESGNKAGHKVSPTLVNGCGITSGTQIKATPVGCEFAIPLCDHAAGPKSLHCVKVGRFQITAAGTGSPNVQGRFLGMGLLRSGAGGSIPTSNADVVVIKLSQ